MRLRLFRYELIIKKIPKSSGYARRSWSASETSSMLRFRSEGKSWREVAQLLNRSEAACISQYHKIKRNKRTKRKDATLTEEKDNK